VSTLIHVSSVLKTDAVLQGELRTLGEFRSQADTVKTSIIGSSQLSAESIEV